MLNSKPYELKRTKLNVHNIDLEIETLKDLNKTIDDIFTHIEDQTKADKLEHDDVRLLEDLCPYFGVVWPSARALSEHLASLGPETFQGAQVLELGCGLALPSLIAAKLGAQVTATDFHPEVPAFLERNLKLNGITNLAYNHMNWRTQPPPAGPYDWVIAADVLYEKEHPESLAQAMAHAAGKKGRILLADPARPYLQSFVDHMNQLGYRHDMIIKTIDDQPTAKDIFIVVLNRRFNS